MMTFQGPSAETRARNQQDTLKLDPEGNWYQGDYPILHERTCSYLHKHIERDKEGNYFLTGEDKPVPILVEDVPFWVSKIEKTIAGYLITLTDESVELLDPTTLWQGKRGALYCLVKGGQFPAKFQRAPYYEITRGLEGRGHRFSIVISGKKYPVSKVPLGKKSPKKKVQKKKSKKKKR